MKLKYYYFIWGLLILAFVFVFAGKHPDTALETDGGSLTFSISRTNADTSEEFNSSPNMTFGYVAYDTIDGNDSLAARLYVDSHIGTFFNTKYWKCEDSLDLVGIDSLPDRWIFTSSSRSNAKKYRFRLAGIDSNRNKSPNFFSFVIHEYEE